MDPTPSDWREARRFRAFELKQDGWKQTDIAEALGVSEGAVSQWMKKAREGGKEALKTEPRPGRPPKLSEEERTERLPSLLEKGPEHFGFRGEVWTRKRVRKVIKEKFKVEYDVSQVGRILGSDRVEPPKTRPPVRQARRKGDRRVERGGVATN
jgi:transposase